MTEHNTHTPFDTFKQAAEKFNQQPPLEYRDCNNERDYPIPAGHAPRLAEDGDDELGVDHYAVDHDLDILFVDFYRSGSENTDLQVVGGSFAGAVDAGLSVSTLAADALNDDGSSGYIFDVERSDAQAFMADEISESEYLARIEATIE